MSKETAKHAQLASAISAKNEASGYGRKFVYGGYTYDPWGSRTPDIANDGQLNPALEEQAAAYHALFEKHRADEDKLRQILRALSVRFPTEQDLRNALPEEMVSHLSVFDGTTRTRPREQLMALVPHLDRQANTLLDIFHYYRSMELLTP